MISELPFPHHSYQHVPVDDDFELIPASAAVPIEDPAADHIPKVASRFRANNVREIVLVHGTFVGNDIAGLLREIARFSPQFADVLKRLGKRVFDQVTGEIGNYTSTFAGRLEKLVNDSDSDPIKVSLFHWSGENHHLGRAAGAMSLLEHILNAGYEPSDRMMIWGHSHGGNLLAMLSLLVGGSQAAKERFFKATRSHYRDPILGRLDLPLWDAMRQELSRSNLKEKLPQIDAVNFGVPLRYRWNRDVVPGLLNFVQHRSLDEAHPERAKFPTSIREVIGARGGDYVQQLGIGGTDFLHSVFAWRSWNSERRLRLMFAKDVRRRDLLDNIRRGLRVSMDGKTLLVDYPTTKKKWNQKVVGHGVYTRHEWIPFHLNQIASRMYKDQTHDS